MWMVRAGRAASYVEDFIEKGIVAIGWKELGQLGHRQSRGEIAKHVAHTWPKKKKGQVAISAGQLYRFFSEIKVGDAVLTYNPGTRVYHLGRILSDHDYDITLGDLPRFRRVEWEHEVRRDLLGATTRNSLGAISTLFQIPDRAASELFKLSEGNDEGGTAGPGEPVDDPDGTLDEIRERSRELIKDKINELEAYDFQDLVAGVLRAMGYKTRVSPPGADRGIDILASPDGFGFEQPRIIVECKHRPGSAMGAQDIRTFLGGRHKDDKGLFVSTGGFTKDARYEAERANVPTTLMDLNQLVDAILEHYANVDSETRILLPLSQVYWPAE